jgi:hypothetical protein
MAEERRQVREGRLERQGASLVQRGQPRETRIETSSTRGRLTARLFLRPHEGDESEADQRKDSQRPGFTDQ